MKAGMTWLRLPVILIVLALVILNNQCLAACVIEPAQPANQENVPPCHRHQAPARCSHSPLLADYRAPAVSAIDLIHDSVIAFLPAQSVVVSLNSLVQVASQDASPPGLFRLLSFPILRI
jgi:hypothetical protein